MADLGTCPACKKGTIIESDRAYGCDHWRRTEGDCHFTIWKTIAGHHVTASEAQALIAGKTIGPLPLTSKAGKAFEASLHVDDLKTGHVEFIFAPREEKHDTPAPTSGAPTDDLPF